MGEVFRPLSRKLVLIGALVVLAAGLVSTAMVSAAASPTPVDHFLCYTAAAPAGFRVPSNVRLLNQFTSNGIVPKFGAVDMHCNPVQKSVPTHVSKITNPNAHLLCWRITAPAQPTHVVRVTNQFGQAVLQTGQPTQVCLPSWKSLTGPPRKPTPAPPGLSHFTCYPVSYVPGAGTFKVPPAVQLKDQFSQAQVTVKVGNPVKLCLPSLKIVNGQTFPPTNTVTHLLCFTVGPTPTKNPVYDQNQFGTGKIQIQRTQLLCLPSTKQILK
jgi:hypothetical protein